MKLSPASDMRYAALIAEYYALAERVLQGVRRRVHLVERLALRHVGRHAHERRALLADTYCAERCAFRLDNVLGRRDRDARLCGNQRRGSCGPERPLSRAALWFRLEQWVRSRSRRRERERCRCWRALSRPRWVFYGSLVSFREGGRTI